VRFLPPSFSWKRSNEKEKDNIEEGKGDIGKERGNIRKERDNMGMGEGTDTGWRNQNFLLNSQSKILFVFHQFSAGN
jgi:hypothetical protein